MSVFNPLNWFKDNGGSAAGDRNDTVIAADSGESMRGGRKSPGPTKRSDHISNENCFIGLVTNLKSSVDSS